MDYRSPLESIFGIISGLPQGHDKPVKHAVYNAVALFLLALCCAAGWALYMILEPFIKPLIWALLVGSALHPLKRSLKAHFQTWFSTLEETGTPVVLGVFLLPINIINYASEFIGSNLLKRIKIIVGVCIAIPSTHVVYYYTPSFITSLFWSLFTYSSAIINILLSISTATFVVVIFMGYFSTILFLWKPENNFKFHFASTIIWLIGSCYVARLFGPFQLVLFIFLQIILLVGFSYEVYSIYVDANDAGHPITIIDALLLVFNCKSIELDSSDETSGEPADKSSECDTSNETVDENVPKNTVTFQEPKTKSCTDTKSQKSQKDPWALDLFEEEKSTSQLSDTSLLINNQGIHVIQKPKHLQPFLNAKETKRLKRSLSQPQFHSKPKTSLINLTRKLSFIDSNKTATDDEKYESTFYLYSIMWACVVMIFWKNSMLIALLPVPILIYVIKHVGYYLSLWSWLNERLTSLLNLLSVWCYERHDALIPVPVRGLYRITDKINNYLKESIKNSIDTVASCVVIFGLIVFLICASIFIVLQIYAEAIMMVQMTSNVINQTVVHNPELRQLLPPGWDETVDSILDNAYLYGREGISKAVKSMMSEMDIAKSEKLEKQVLELWDRVYQSLMSADVHGPKVTDEAVRSSWDEFVEDLKKSPEMFNVNGLVDFAKQNVGTLMSLLESVWSIVKGNIGIVLGSFSAFLSVILGGGTAVLNFILNVVVFLTTLFYLLNSSDDLYKPVELLTNFSNSGSRFGHALEDAINGVFSASFKMAAFYGLWTWFIHNLFGVKIVYLPSAFATILGAIPFLGTYWACVPAVLDLWLAQDRGISAILFALFQFLPTSIVDTTIYKEIKGGGHPYLTGLAIAGGIFCLGVEGAIMGPLLLCGLYVVIDLSSSLFKDSPSEEALNLRFKSIN